MRPKNPIPVDDQGSDRCRREFLGDLGRLAAASGVAAALSSVPASASVASEAASANKEAKVRRAEAVKLRRKIAKKNLKHSIGALEANGDEDTFPNAAGNFSKGLPHQSNGEVDPAAYQQLLKALRTGKPAHFENIPLGCPDPGLQRKLCNPQGGLAFDLEGLDVCQVGLDPAPSLSSGQAAGEMVELMWMSRLRDVNFDDYGQRAGAGRGGRAVGDERFSRPQGGGCGDPRSPLPR